jgi:hypothetical protein
MDRHIRRVSRECGGEHVLISSDQDRSAQPGRGLCDEVADLRAVQETARDPHDVL